MVPARVRIFASHPIAWAQYRRLLCTTQGCLVVEDEGAFDVGVFDGELPSLDAVLALAVLCTPLMRPVPVTARCDEGACLGAGSCAKCGESSPMIALPANLAALWKVWRVGNSGCLLQSSSRIGRHSILRIYCESARAIVGEHSKRAYRLGARVRARLDRIDPEGNKLQFSLV